MRQPFEARVRTIVPPGRIAADAVLAPFTTFKVGGPADWLVEVRSRDELLGVLAAARAAGVPVTILGGGSNVLVSDRGVRGVVIRPRLTGVAQPAPGVVRAEAGVTMNGLVRWTVGRGLAGLEAWAGTPGTVGGAIFGNAHFGGRNIGDLVVSVEVVASDGSVAVIPHDAMQFAYDTSRLRDTGEVAVSADVAVTAGEPDVLRATARASLAHRKRTQPLDVPSAGCIFQNPDPGRDMLPEGIPASAGALVDRAGFKGRAIGGASVSTVHANFVVNRGDATAADVYALAEAARAAVRAQFGVDLRREIVVLGEF